MTEKDDADVLQVFILHEEKGRCRCVSYRVYFFVHEEKERCRCVVYSSEVIFRIL